MSHCPGPHSWAVADPGFQVAFLTSFHSTQAYPGFPFPLLVKAVLKCSVYCVWKPAGAARRIDLRCYVLYCCRISKEKKHLIASYLGFSRCVSSQGDTQYAHVLCGKFLGQKPPILKQDPKALTKKKSPMTKHEVYIIF